MSPFVPPSQFGLIHETAHWWVNHRCDTVYPGYLMVAAKHPNAQSLTRASGAFPPRLSRKWVLYSLAAAWRCRTAWGAIRVYHGLYGHTTGHAPHYHVIPLYEWTLRMFEGDERCARLQMFHAGVRMDSDFPPYTTPDGLDMTLFINRRFAEPGVEPPSHPGPTVEEVIAILRTRLDQDGS